MMTPRPTWFVSAALTVLLATLLLSACGDEATFGNDTRSSPGASPTRATPVASSPAPTIADAGGTPSPVGTPTVDEDGFHENLTIEQAQALVPFDIVVPEPIPAELRLVEIAAIGDGTEHGPSVTMLFESTSAAGIGMVSLSQGHRFDIPGADTWSSFPMFEQTKLAFGEMSVNRTSLGVDQCFGSTAYEWESAGIAFNVMNTGVAGVEVEREPVERLIAAMIGAEQSMPEGSVAAGGRMSPTANFSGDYCALTADEAREIAPFPILVPGAVPAPFRRAAIHIFDDGYSLVSLDRDQGTTPVVSSTLIESKIVFQVEGTDQFSHVVLRQFATPELAEEQSFGWFGEEPDVVLSIGGVEVRKVSIEFQSGVPANDSGTPTEAGSEEPIEAYAYEWSIGERHFMLEPQIHPDDAALVSDADLEGLIATLIDAS